MVCPECKKKVGNSINLKLIVESNDKTITQEAINNSHNISNTTRETTFNVNNDANINDEYDDLNSITSLSELRSNTKIYIKSLKRKRELIEKKQSEQH